MRRITVGTLLRDGKNMPLMSIPYSRQILTYAPEDVALDPARSAKENYDLLVENKKVDYLNTKVEEILVEQEGKKIRQMLRWSLFTGTFGGFGALVAVIYISIIQGTFPDTWLVGFLVGIPGLIMWAQAGVLKSDAAANLGKILSTIPSKKGRSFTPREYDEDMQYYQRSQDYGDGGTRHQDGGNGNPFR